MHRIGKIIFFAALFIMATGMIAAFTTCKTMTNKRMEYRYYISGNAPELYPTEIWYSALFFEQDEALPIPKCYPYRGEWGEILSTEILSRENYPMPIKLDIAWLSIVEQQFYQLETDLPADRFQSVWDQAPAETFSHIVLGMAPHGGVALWCVGYDKSVLVEWMHAKTCEVNFRDFKHGDQYSTLENYCARYLEGNPLAKEHAEDKGLPQRDLYDNYMKQFTYRYQIEFGQWDEDKKEWMPYADNNNPKAEFEYIEECLFDGTHDKLHDGSLMNYHQAGKPKKLAVKWHTIESEYTAYLWFEDEDICSVFNRFYGSNTEVKTDLTVKIDTDKNKYELSLLHYGQNDPQVISESAYQIIVFKDEYECYRSDNYNQERGAWVW